MQGYSHYGYSLFTGSSFDLTKNKLDCYRGKDCLQKFCKDVKEHTTKIINYEKNKMIPSTDKENKPYKEQNDEVLMIIIKGIINSEIIVTTQ